MAVPRRPNDPNLEQLAARIAQSARRAGANFASGVALLHEPATSTMLMDLAVDGFVQAGVSEAEAVKRIERSIADAKAKNTRFFHVSWCDAEDLVERLEARGDLSRILSPPPPGEIWMVLLEVREAVIGTSELKVWVGTARAPS